MNKPVTKAGRYQVVSELGRGAMGVVYEGFDPVIGRAVAIKTMLTEGLSGNEFETYRARFQREAQAAGVLAHPNIVTIYDFGEDEGFLFLAMELLRGKSLEKLLQEQSVLPIETIIPIYQQVCSALDFAHDHKIVHRDIKPANIMILENGQVKVADFGIAKMMATGMTRAGQILGTPNYMSPEQVKGRGVDGRSDIFALGVILYELVTGEKPFSGQNVTTVIYKIMHENPIPPRELEPTIHPSLSYVITKALAKSMDERYQTCAELAEDLKNYRNLGAQSAANTTAVIQRPMLEMAPNETAAIDVSMLRGPASAQPASPVPTPPAPAPPVSSPQAHTPAPPAPRVETAPPRTRPAPPAQAPPRFETTPEIRPQIQAPPAVPPTARVEPSPPVETPRVQAPPSVQPVSQPVSESRRERSGETTAPTQPKPALAPVAAPAELVAATQPKTGGRISPLIWVGAAALLAIAIAGGYLLPHRGQVAPSSPPAAGVPKPEPEAAGSGVVTPDASSLKNNEPAGQTGEPRQETKTAQASPPPVVQPSRHAQTAASAAAPERTVATAPAPKPPSSRSKPATSAAGTGEVTITANVDGAKVSVDGKGEADWIAPHTLSLPAGAHRVAVLKDGYVTWGKNVVVEAGSTQSISAELLPPQGEVDIITDPPGLEVFIDGKSVGVTPVQTMVSVGEHKYRINPPPGQSPLVSTFVAKETSIARKTISFR